MKKMISMILLMGAWMGCQGPQVKPTTLPEWETLDMQVAEQGLTDFTLTLVGKLKPQADVVLDKATYELVVDGNVVSKGTQTLGISIAAGQTGSFSISQSSSYVKSAEDLAAMSARGGSLLSAIRGVAYVKQGETLLEIPYARSREIRVPRLPSVKLEQVDAARFSDKECQATFSIGIDNPNPFSINLKGLNYSISIGGKPMEEGMRGAGEKIAKSSREVFEIELMVNEATYGKEAQKLIQTRTLPYQIQGSVAGDLFQIPYSLSGNIKVNVSK